MKNYFCIFLILLFCQNISIGQINFRESLTKADPAPKSANLSIPEMIEIHNEFLTSAISENNTLHQLYGNLFLYLDYVRKEEFVEAADYILQAKTIAENSENESWIGWVHYRAGLMYSRMDEEEKTINTYKSAAQYCAIAGDSLCLGESLEQLSSFEAILGNLLESKKYYERAMPLLEKYGTERNIVTAANNHAITLSIRGLPEEAIPLFEKAILHHSSKGNLRAQGKSMNNLADAYRRLKESTQSIEIYKNALKFNQANDFQENMIPNFMGLYLVYSELGKHEEANEFLIKRYELRDSLIGEKTKNKIAELETKYQTKENELALQRTQSKLTNARNKNQLWAIGFVFLAIAFLVIIWIARNQKKIANIKIQNYRDNLKNQANSMLEKNKLLQEIQNELDASNSKESGQQEESTFSKSIYNKRILTEFDWAEFKGNFDKAYPGYLLTLRNQYSALTEAEERLFIFIGLKFTSREIADILGITTESVKKIRYRLRKKLMLEEKEELNNFVYEFHSEMGIS